MRARKYILCLSAAALMLSAGCSKPACNGEELLIEWHDADSKITFRVTERSGVMVNTYTRLYVERGGRVDGRQIDDAAIFATISFVRYENWLLVLSDNEVWAGYET